MTAYFISGLGADSRNFQNLSLHSGINIIHIKWIEPLGNEKLRDYCLRLSSQMNVKDDFVLVGLSFGGIIAVELGEILNPRLVVLISSISNRHELPVALKAVNFLKLHRIVPGAFLKWHNKLADWYFTAKTNEERTLLSSFLRASTIPYLRWSVDQLLNWKRKKRAANIFHIHGTKDRIFPIRRIKADVQIQNGGHLMVYDMADKVSKALSKKLIG